MLDPVVMFLSVPNPDEQDLTSVLHDYFRAVGRPDLRLRVPAVMITGPGMVHLVLEHGGYSEADAPVVRFGMGLVAERYAELCGENGRALVPVHAGRFDLEELLRRHLRRL